MVLELRGLNKKILDLDVAFKLLLSVSKPHTISVEEIISTLDVHEDKLKDHLIKREEKQKAHSDRNRGRGRGHGRGRSCGKGSGRCSFKIEDSDDKSFFKDKSKVTCYNYKKKGHYSNECWFPKKKRSKNDEEKANVTKEQITKTTLLMTFEVNEVL
ncbi:unnamed protein product [Spirodela intermedia]|uniref:Uncharacterized protein n=1 Tax=Spirodela intermedia TaxID=51605 RepID=A0A7I8KYE6_SPIIN|nr:unnamed protein product [Spirodela intermedia]